MPHSRQGNPWNLRVVIAPKSTMVSQQGSLALLTDIRRTSAQTQPYLCKAHPNPDGSLQLQLQTFPYYLQSAGRIRNKPSPPCVAFGPDILLQY